MPGTPSLAPLYPDPPVEYREARLLVAVVDGGAPAGVLASGLEPGGAPMRAVIFADYPDTSIGPYREVVVLTSASFADTDGLFCPLIYVTSDAALCAGREIWGFPKKMAEIELETGDGETRARLVRASQELVVIEGSASEPAEPTAIGGLGASPIFNHKQIPAPTGKEPDVDTLTAVRIESVVHAAWTGTGVLRAAGEVATVLGETAPVTLIRSVSDMVLPAGETLG